MRTFLTKHHSNIQLMHLYEHLVLSSVYAYMSTQGYYEFIDYTIKGDTFYNGLCLIEIEASDPAVHSSIQAHIDTSPIFDLRQINDALTEIEAERQAYITRQSDHAIATALKTLIRQPWRPFGEHQSVVGKSTAAMPLAIDTSQPYPKTHKLYASLELPASIAAKHRQLLPLFRIVIQAVAWNLGTQVSEKYSLYNNLVSYEGDFGTAQSAELSWQTPAGYLPDLDALIADSRRVTHAMHADKAFDRLCYQLQTLDYTNQSTLYPDMFETYAISHLMPTYAEWKQLATIENCQLLASEVHVTLHHDEETETSNDFFTIYFTY